MATFRTIPMNDIMVGDVPPDGDVRPDKQLTEELRAQFKKEGASLVGFANIERYNGAPKNQHPRRYLPDTRSLISIAIHINEGVCEHVAQKNVATWHSFQIYTLGIVNPLLDRLALTAAMYLEDRGYLAYPFPANSPHDIRPTREYPGGPGDISHKHVAVACGVGELGWHTMLLTPEFGTRQKLVSVITTAPLAADPMLKPGSLCDAETCGYLCAKSCPTAAIPKKKIPEVTVGLTMDGHRMEYSKLIGWRCRWGCSGMLKNTGGYKNIPMPKEEPLEEELLKYKAQMDPWQLREQTKTYAGLVPYCGKCLCVCPVKRGRRPFTRPTASN